MWPSSCAMSPYDALPSMIIIGNSVPPRSRRRQDDRTPRHVSVDIDRHPWCTRFRYTRPTGIALDHDAGRTENLVVAENQGDVIRRELAIELPGGNEGVRLPASAIVHGDLR